MIFTNLKILSQLYNIIKSLMFISFYKMQMKFKYALVARNTQPLAEYSMTTNSIRDIALSNLKDYNPNDRYSLSRINDLIYLSLNEPNRIRYLIVCEPSTKRDVGYNL